MIDPPAPADRPSVEQVSVLTIPDPYASGRFEVIDLGLPKPLLAELMELASAKALSIYYLAAIYNAGKEAGAAARRREKGPSITFSATTLQDGQLPPAGPGLSIEPIPGFDIDGDALVAERSQAAGSGPLTVEPSMADAAEMLWVVLANVSGGNWTKQTPEWQEAAARWRDNYFAALKGDAGAAALLAPIWDCRICGFGVREGTALLWIREHGEHYNAVSEKVPNAGTAYCPTCSDETLRHPSPQSALASPLSGWQPIDVNDVETEFAQAIAGELEHYAQKIAKQVLRRVIAKLQIPSPPAARSEQTE